MEFNKCKASCETTEDIENIMPASCFMEGDYSQQYSENINKYKSFFTENEDNNYKILTVLDDNYCEHNNYSDYNMLLVHAKDYSDFEKYLKINENSIWFSDENTLIKFAEFLYINTYVDNDVPLELFDIEQVFRANKRPIRFDENKDCYEFENAILVYFKQSFTEIIGQIKNYKETMKEIIFAVCDIDVSCDNWIFYY